ncbi:amino-acid permease [Viridothelium virens]|uniref:Amino-acid permease n=1 Tax=Viridothelium virens TaxID=1048519 RepID=A0A6A6GZB5_VIRVR|nr:amino-acid permease [Viridothelium virens]
MNPPAPAYTGKGSNHEELGAAKPYSESNDALANGPSEVEEGQGGLKRGLHGRHMQMIAIGGAIGAGLFVGTGSALQTGGPAGLLIGYIIVGVMMLCTIQALGELATLYPVNGAYFTYFCRFLDPSWGFALGWDYAIGWLVILPFEITAAGITIQFWRSDLNIGIWIAVFLALLVIVQFFGVRGYGEVEFVLSIIKVLACTGFIILGVVIDCGGVPTDNRGYIGAHYWHDPGAFRNGFHGFCTVFVTAAFAFGGTELTGLAAAESADPTRMVPKATRQVFWRICFFYIVNIFIVGLIVPADNPNLLNATGAKTAYSPFVIAIRLAGIKALPSIFNAVITISVLSVANSATFASTRTIQALAMRGMAPKFLAYVDRRGRPVPTVILQLLFGLLAFVNEAKKGSTVFDWLLALSGVSNFFVWGSICASHLRFRQAWRAQGYSLSQLPYRATLGVGGSWVGLILNVVCLIAQFYVAVWPVGSSPDAGVFFQAYLAAPLILALYGGWKIYSSLSGNPLINSRGWKPFIRTHEIDLATNRRENILREDSEPERRESLAQEAVSFPKKVFTALI